MSDSKKPQSREAKAMDLLSRQLLTLSGKVVMSGLTYWLRRAKGGGTGGHVGAIGDAFAMFLVWLPLSALATVLLLPATAPMAAAIALSGLAAKGLGMLCF